VFLSNSLQKKTAASSFPEREADKAIEGRARYLGVSLTTELFISLA